MLKILPIPALEDNYIWTIVHPNTLQCVMVDPGDAIPALDVLIELKLNLKAILVTHHHWDHTNGIDAILQKFSCPVIGLAQENIPLCQRKVKEGDRLEIPHMDLSLQVLDIPGHTKGHVAYYGHGAVFTGDTLFTGGCGRIFEGTAQQMWDSLHKLMALPDETLIYCGHEYTGKNLQFANAVEPDNLALLERINTTANLRAENKPSVPATLRLEKATNPFLRVEVAQVQEAIKHHFGHNLTDPVGLFAALRRWKNTF